MSYCVKVAAYTKVGIGPFTRLECVEMTMTGLLNNRGTQKNNDILTEEKNIFYKTWFIVLMLALCFTIILVLFGLMRYVKRGSHKFGKKSSGNGTKKSYVLASENFTLLNKSANALVQSKFNPNGTNMNSGGSTSESNHYKLVSDTIWLDTLNSFSNQSNHEFQGDPDLQNQIYFKQSKQKKIHTILKIIIF